MRTLSKRGITEDYEKMTIGHVISLFVEHGNISIEHKDALFFIDAMRKYHKKVKFEMLQADVPHLVKFKKK